MEVEALGGSLLFIIVAQADSGREETYVAGTEEGRVRREYRAEDYL